MTETRPFTSDRALDLICMGRVAVDFYADQIHSPLEEAQSFSRYLGGCAGNISVGTSRLGLKSAMFSCIGTDDMGIFLRKQLQREGVDTTLLRSTPDHLTGLVVLGVSPPDRFPLIFYRENCADMQIRPEDVDPIFFRRAKALQITGTGLSTDSMCIVTKQAIRVAKKAGCAVIIDIDYRPVLWGLTERGDGESRFVASASVTRIMQPFLTDLDLIIGTEEELMIVGGGESLETAITKIRKVSDATLVLKRGEKGCEVYVSGRDSPVLSRSFPIKVMNILGAGDAFASGFLRGWLREETLETCALWGNANGALTVTRHGCSPSMASFLELQHLIENFDRNQDILESPELLRLHQRTVLGQPRNHPLFLFDMGHRSEFEESCRAQNLPESHIREFKDQVFQGFRKVAKVFPELPLALLVDPIYGSEILQESAYASYRVGVPIEKAGFFPTEWLCGEELHKHLRERPSEWFVKVLWRFHTDLSPEKKSLQLKRLFRLNEVCRDLDRRLMLELILPDLMPQNNVDQSGSFMGGEDLAGAMSEVYDADVYPFWWKIRAPDSELDWNRVTETLDFHDPEAAVIISYAHSSEDKIEKWSKIIRTTPYACGFAIGRSIFWEPWEAYASGTLDATEIPAIIAEGHQKFLHIWSGSTN